jgi:hypothetical protein
MRDEAADQGLRLEAARTAAPNVHPRLSAVTVRGDEDEPLRMVSRIELVPVEPRARG